MHPATDPAHDLTGRQFARDLGANFAALLDRHSIPPLVIGAAAAGFATIPEQQLEQHFARADMWGPWSTPGKYLGNSVILGGISATMFAFSRKSDNRKFRSLSYSLFQGAIMSASIVQPTKAITWRQRPNGKDHFSFPSGHATDSFLYATILADHLGWKAAVPGYMIAAYVCATRLEERKHHLTDIVAGAALGYLVGRTVTRRMHGNRSSRITFQVSPSGSGLVGAVRIALP